MAITRKSSNLETMKDLYDMMKNPEIQKLSSIKGEELPVGAFVLYTDVNTKGEEIAVCSIRDKDTGVVYATNSPTFIREFTSILSMTDEAKVELHTVKVSEGVSRAGRNFITCVYVD